jgi:enoyl-CoA hydratase/carnithine racemase
MAEVVIERIGHVSVLTLNRPEARNAINLATAQALDAALTEAEHDADVLAIVLTGAEDKAFSAGMDLKAFARGEMPFTEHGFAGITRRHLRTPLICAANGSAFAGGFEVVLSCDLVVAADHALFGLPEVQRGLFAGAGGLLRLPRRIPRAIATEMALTGEPITAARAYELGLVNAVVPFAQLRDRALALAERIAANAPMAVRLSKAILRDTMDLSEERAWERNDQSFAEISTSGDALEGAIAFAEKRPPVWRSR